MISSDEIYLKVKDLEFEAIVTSSKKVVDFVGGEDFWGRKRTWTEEKVIQTLNKVEIFGSILSAEIENIFKAQGAKIIISAFDWEAVDYLFSGVTLNHTYNLNGKGKSGLFSGPKKYSNHDKHQSIEGVEVCVGDKGYIIAEGKIWLESSHIGGKEVNIKSPKIELEGLVGANYHNIWVQKSSIRFTLSCSFHELSFGVDKKFEEKTINNINQFLSPSSITGAVVNIETDTINQHGSYITGGKGKIKARSWQASAPALVNITDVQETKVTVGLKIGIQENVSKAFKGANNTVSSFGEGGKYALLNTVSNLAGNAFSVANLMTGGVIGPVCSISASASFSSFNKTFITHGTSQVDFDELEIDVTEDIAGDLEIKSKVEAEIKAARITLTKKEDETHTSSSSTGFSLSTKSIGAHHYQEKDGKGFGAGVNIGFDNSSLLGNEYRVMYKDGKDKLDVTFQSIDLPKLQNQLNQGTVYSRAIASFNNTVGEIFGQIGLKYEPLHEVYGVAAGENKQEEEREEVAEDKLKQYKKLPPSLSMQDTGLVGQIRAELEEEHSYLDKATKEEIVALSYHIHKKYESNPELAPKTQLAAAAAVPLAGPVVEIATPLDSVVMRFEPIKQYT